MALQSLAQHFALGVALSLCFANITHASDCSSAGNALTDPSFENQTPVASGGWNAFGGAFSPEYARTGMWSFAVAAYFGVTGSVEQLPAAPGSRWRMTGYGFTPLQLQGAPAIGVIQVTFFDAFGNDLGTVETAGSPFPAKTSNPVDWSTPVGVWTYLDTGAVTAPAGAAFIQAFTLYVDFSGYSQRVFFDDLSLQVLGANHGGYVSSVAQNAVALRRAGSISQAQEVAMVAAAAQSNVGKRCAGGE